MRGLLVKSATQPLLGWIRPGRANYLMGKAPRKMKQESGTAGGSKTHHTWHETRHLEWNGR